MMLNYMRDLHVFNTHSGGCGFQFSLHIVADFPRILVRFDCCFRAGLIEIYPGRGRCHHCAEYSILRA